MGAEKEKSTEIFEWAKAYSAFELTEWERLPDIELYMDQLINYLGRLLKLQERSESAPLLTASMVNNYVKDGYIERPQQKKYDKGQIASLYMLCSMKHNLSVAEAATLLSMLSETATTAELYESFGKRQHEIAEELTHLLLTLEKEQEKELVDMALNLTLRSCAERLIAERILMHLTAEKQGSTANVTEEKTQSQQKKEENKSKEKEKKKKEEKKQKKDKLPVEE